MQRRIVYYLIITYMVALPLGGFSVSVFGKYPVQPSWIVGIFTVFFYLLSFMSKNVRIRNDIIIISLATLYLCVLMSIISPIISSNQNKIIDFITTFIQFSLSILIFFAFTRTGIDGRLTKNIIKWHIIVISIVSLYGILQFIFAYFGHPLIIDYTNPKWENQTTMGYEVYLAGFRRSSSIFREPRQFGAYVIGVIVILYYCLTRRTIFRIFRSSVQVFFLVICVAGLVCSMSSSAILICGVSLLVVTFFHFGTLSPKKVVSSFVLGVCILGTVLIVSGLSDLPYWNKRLNPPEMERLVDVFTELPDRHTAYGGYVHYVGNMGFIYRLFKESPILGVGVNNLVHHELAGYHGAHQPWAFIGQCGLLGFSAFVFFIGIFLYQIGRLKKRGMKLGFLNNEDIFLLEIASLLILLAPIKGMGSLFNYFTQFFWFDASLAGLIYFCINRKVRYSEKFSPV